MELLDKKLLLRHYEERKTGHFEECIYRYSSKSLVDFAVWALRFISR